MVGDVRDVITCSKFQIEIFMSYDFTGGRIFNFPIGFCLGLTTVQRYCAACDDDDDDDEWWSVVKINGEYENTRIRFAQRLILIAVACWFVVDYQAHHFYMELKWPDMTVRGTGDLSSSRWVGGRCMLQLLRFRRVGCSWSLLICIQLALTLFFVLRYDIIDFGVYEFAFLLQI